MEKKQTQKSLHCTDFSSQELQNKDAQLEAIRLKCLDCCCDSKSEVRLCTATECPLYAFRFGRLTYRHKGDIKWQQV